MEEVTTDWPLKNAEANRSEPLAETNETQSTNH
jgi:hypothetical protein